MKLATLGKFFISLVLIILYLILGINDLDKDVINPDGINWHNRTSSFSKALVTGDYADTYQVYHPGITLMWISGPLLHVFHKNTATITDPKSLFLSQDYFAKLSLVIFSTLIFIITLIVLWKLSGFKYAMCYSLIFTLEPFILGMRRLYHLDYLMAILIFLSFLLIIYFNYKSQKWYLLPLAGLFYALALLTKSTAVIVLAAFPFIFLLGNSTFYKKLLGFLLFVISVFIFIYAFFPALWKNPLKSFPKYYERISSGAVTIGIDGKAEKGASGKEDNITLDETVETKDSNFYFYSLFLRFSIVGSVLLIVSIGVFAYFYLKGFIASIVVSIKNKKIQSTYNYSTAGWIAFWSLGIVLAILVGLTIATKKSDRYEILVFPFLITVIAYFLTKAHKYITIILLLFYVSVTYYELSNIRPYYISYSNPYLGGIHTRIYSLDDAPFGIGSYEAFQIVKDDMAKNNYSGYYTIAGSKSIKAIAVGGKFSRFPSCVTDYVIAYSLEIQPTENCVQKYVLIDSVRISGFNYWNVYKRLNQKHESNYE